MMTRTDTNWPSKGWRRFAAIYTCLNVAGGIFALANGEPMHAAVHATLTIIGIGAYLIWRASRSDVRVIPPPVDPTSELMDRLQQSVDRIALDVERVGEAQRFQAKLLEKHPEDLTR